MTRKERHEAALKVERLLESLPPHEVGAVLQMVGISLQAELKNLELGTLQQQAMQAAAVPTVSDEHYRA